MNTIKIAKSAARNVAVLTLEQAPLRALKFLQATTGDADIQKQLATEVGWSGATEKQGWALLARLSDASVAAAPEAPSEAVEATVACEKVQSISITRVRTVLETTHPEQAQFLFHDFVGGKGAQAVFNVATFVQRCHQLTHGAGRKASRKADAEAMKIIEETSKESLRELAALVHVAQSGAVAPTSPPSERDPRAERLEVLRNIHAWVMMWSGLARSAITRREQLIRLGIAKRRAKKEAPVATPATPAASDNGPESHAA